MVLLKCKSVLVLLFKPKGFISVKIPTVAYMALRNLLSHYLCPCFSFYPPSFTLSAILPPSCSLPEVRVYHRAFSLVPCLNAFPPHCLQRFTQISLSQWGLLWSPYLEIELLLFCLVVTFYLFSSWYFSLFYHHLTYCIIYFFNSAHLSPPTWI